MPPPLSPSPTKREEPLLEKFLWEFERLSGFRLCVYDLDSFTTGAPKLNLSEEISAHHSPYCHFMKTCSLGKAKCVQTENWKTQEAAKHPRGFFHTCYAGVTDFVAPIVSRGKHVGAVMVGQAWTLPPVERAEKIAAAVEELHLPPHEAKKAAAALPEITQAKLARIAWTARFVKDYIEQAQELAALKREISDQNLDLAPTAESAVRLGKFPFDNLQKIRRTLHGKVAEAIRKAIDVIEKDYAGDLKHQRVARTVGMSVSHFSRVFRHETGLTFRHVLLETRLNVAFLLIKRYDASIGEAAGLVGYSDECSFRRAFWKFTGLGPRDYIRTYPRTLVVSPKSAP